jgi:serine phosphatase RsbU (regulator of sigma subunit)/pSer/pThr/pTyr-binding forkhead associated (FHA) protein
MASLLITQGPNIGQRFALGKHCAVVGRQPDTDIYLDSLAVSRRHAQILLQEGAFFVEDLESSNGTFVNSARLTAHERTRLTEHDVLQIGPYVMALRSDPTEFLSETDQVIRARVDAQASNRTLFGHNAAHKLQVVLEIAQHLGRTLDAETLFGQLLDHLLRLFPQADRGMVLLCEGEHFAVRAQRSRIKRDHGDYPFSRTIVRRALDDGVGLLSEDVGDDPKLVLSATLMSLNLRSFLCVPLIGKEGRRLGVIQLDCLRAGQVFRADDLEVLTALALHVSVVVENALLHAELLREARLRQELMVAREIQQQFLPTDFGVGGRRYELYARVHPAREVSGDLYDFFPLPDGRLAFFLGDVSGKGMPAALFMIAVRTLSRHLAPSARGPADMLLRLNEALVADNPTALFVTLAHGVYDADVGTVVLALGAHPAPLLRRADGTVEEVAVKPTVMLGCPTLELAPEDVRLRLAPGETLILYTDGFTEAFAPDGKTMFGLERLREVLGGSRAALPLEKCAEAASAAVRAFTGGSELQDDQTLLLLRCAAVPLVL